MKQVFGFWFLNGTKCKQKEKVKDIEGVEAGSGGEGG